MTDPRNKKLAHNLIHYSCKLQKGENILIEASGDASELVRELVREAYACGAYPIARVDDASVKRSVLKGLSQQNVELMTKVDGLLMENMQAYISIRGGANASELSDVPQDKLELYSKVYAQRVHHELRVKKTKWCVLRYPTPSMAQMANTSTEAFEAFYFNVCNLDYSKMDRAMDPLVALLDRTDKVRILGPGTDLTFSIKGIPCEKCSGLRNIPDGEIYTAPVRDSINGVISYNTPSIEKGFTYENIRFEFKDGKIIQASANDTQRINEYLDTDEGARYIGEFALGVNPYITKPMKDTLFDEKIAGSIHFTPGSCYDEASNGNESSIHWDLVLIQTPEFGGGEIYFDDVLIRKDGRFVTQELQALNPENLIDERGEGC
ncbi:MAG: aminopeptidase [Christensenellales bacterium]|jgi:aminopeptidase